MLPGVQLQHDSIGGQAITWTKTERSLTHICVKKGGGGYFTILHEQGK